MYKVKQGAQGPKADLPIRLGIETWSGRTHFQKTNSLTGFEGELRATNGKVQGGDKFSGSQEHRNTTHKCPTWAHPGAQGNVTQHAIITAQIGRRPEENSGAYAGKGRRVLDTQLGNKIRAKKPRRARSTAGYLDTPPECTWKQNAHCTPLRPRGLGGLCITPAGGAGLGPRELEGTCQPVSPMPGDPAGVHHLQTRRDSCSRPKPTGSLQAGGHRDVPWVPWLLGKQGRDPAPPSFHSVPALLWMTARLSRGMLRASGCAHGVAPGKMQRHTGSGCFCTRHSRSLGHHSAVKQTHHEQIEIVSCVLKSGRQRLPSYNISGTYSL